MKYRASNKIYMYNAILNFLESLQDLSAVNF